ncbi:MAG: VWA domain-containing protein, partial [Bacteroidales bacterium]|nr:VWA domain-containing protein [Bacteroidales bacterium]
MEKIFLYIACGLFLMACNRAQNQSTTTQPVNELPPMEVDTPKIDIVFCLDATGSMSGLIQTAKEKIWSIASSMTQSEPEPDIRIGMVFYRDRGDNFVTK